MSCSSHDPAIDLTPMRSALEEARKAYTLGEVPVGAVLVCARTGEIVAKAHNRVILDADPSAHAEVLAIRSLAQRQGVPRLPDFDLYVTLEPCPMCATLISFARLRRVIFGAWDAKGGGVAHGARIFDQPTCHHRPAVLGGVEEAESRHLLQQFFRERRKEAKDSRSVQTQDHPSDHPPL